MVLEDHLLLQVLVLDPLDGSRVAVALDQGRKKLLVDQTLEKNINFYVLISLAEKVEKHKELLAATVEHI